MTLTVTTVNLNGDWRAWRGFSTGFGSVTSTDVLLIQEVRAPEEIPRDHGRGLGSVGSPCRIRGACGRGLAVRRGRAWRSDPA